MECPKCGLINPDIAVLCDCGYDFEAKELRTMTAKSPPSRSWFARLTGVLRIWQKLDDLEGAKTVARRGSWVAFTISLLSLLDLPLGILRSVTYLYVGIGLRGFHRVAAVTGVLVTLGGLVPSVLLAARLGSHSDLGLTLMLVIPLNSLFLFLLADACRAVFFWRRICSPPSGSRLGQWIQISAGVIFSSASITIMLALSTLAVLPVYVIPTGAMEDTLLIGDHVVATPAAGYDVKRGDIIVFRSPIDNRQTFVHRVIGIPGDRLKIVNKQVILNGQTINEPYKYHKTDYIDSYRDNFPGEANVRIYEPAIEMLRDNVENGELVVPRDVYFAMGDNRDSSLDSRYWGFVPRENIIGTPRLIYWSLDATADELVGEGAKENASRLLRTPRWERVFKLIRSPATPDNNVK